MKFLIILFALIVASFADVRNWNKIIRNIFIIIIFSQQGEEAIKSAKDELLRIIIAECSAEVGFNIEGGNKLLLGDLSFRSREAQVLLLFHLLLINKFFYLLLKLDIVFRQMCFQEGEFFERSRCASS